MNTHPLVKKASGEKEPFEPEKLKHSLRRAGTSVSVADDILDEILPSLEEGMTTQAIYKKAFSMLRRRKGPDAARYSLKKAIMELGPTGYPFEHFVGQVLASQGFDVKVGVMLEGKCVSHEIDVVATHNHTQYLAECKFYNSQGKYASVQVPLYVRSRVDDIIAFREKLPEYKQTRFFGWVVTNTRFTEDALRYGRCAGLHMLSWDLPANKGLKDMIEKTGVFPITVLTGLNSKQKQYILNKDIVLCRQLKDSPELLDEAGISGKRKNAVLQEIRELVD